MTVFNRSCHSQPEVPLHLDKESALTLYLKVLLNTFITNGGQRIIAP